MLLKKFVFSQFWAEYSLYLQPVIIMLLAFLLVRLIRFSLNKYFIKASVKINADPTNYVYFKNIISFILYTVALLLVIYSIPSLKQLALTLFAGAGILIAIVGFASQQAFSNIISGLFIVVFKPFRVGDLVDVEDGKVGIVENITLRHTVIKDFENRRVIIPNSVISNETVINYSIEESRVCRFIEFGISYDSNIDVAMQIIAKEIEKHPMALDIGETDIRVVGFGDSSVVLRAYVWVDNPENSWKMHHELNKKVKEAFDKGGIEIPYPYRTIVYKSDKVNQSANG